MILLNTEKEYDHPLINRIVKNYRHLKKAGRKASTDCFRVYDRDIPEFRLAADYYAGRFLFQYYSLNDEDDMPEQGILSAVGEGIPAVFGIPKENIFWKTRKKRAMLEQYEKFSDSGDYFECTENGIKFLINLKDYLDTGLFLDHRPAREYAASVAAGKEVLNLYSYTAPFSLYCAKAGASGTVSVDMSNTYSGWAKENFRLNGFDGRKNETVREDCAKYLELAAKERRKFDLIIIDPPTISRSKKMDEMFDVNHDHPWLITKAFGLLRNSGGTILFSTNSRKFRMDENICLRYAVEDISPKMLPEGFRDKKIHKVFTIRSK